MRQQRGAQNPRNPADSWEWKWGAQTLLCPFSATLGLTPPFPTLHPCQESFGICFQNGVGGWGLFQPSRT